MTRLGWFALFAWISFGSFYWGYKHGSKCEMQKANSKLQNAHNIITGGKMKNREEM